MNKLSIRPRNLDACKFIPIYKSNEIPDFHEYASINRSIPQLPTGMEKEEESEHHLQRAISAQQSKGTTGELVIPTPEVYNAPESFYNDLYPQNFKLPRQLIHVQPFAFENDIPDYDRDSEDEAWLEAQKDLPSLTPLKFEELMECFDKNSIQNVISPHHARELIKEDEDLIIPVYDYWLNKRLRNATPLIPVVKTERRDNSTNNNNPYIAFRRRTEKMQTRKNRKNDEISYEKMIKLRRDLSRALCLLQLVKQREETKKEHVKLTVDIFEKRYLLGDFNGNIINEISAQRQVRQASNYLPLNVLKPNENKPPRNKDDGTQPRKKREYRKRHRPEVVQRTEQELSEFTFNSSDDEELNDNLSHSVSDQDEDDSDGPYAFKRKKGCQYYAPQNDSFGYWPSYGVDKRVNLNNTFRLTELRHESNRRTLAYARKRVGRGGRLVFDRVPFESSSFSNSVEMLSDNMDQDDYFKPKSPAFKNHQSTYPDSMDEDSINDLLFIEDGNLSSSVPLNLNDYLHENDDVFSKCIRTSEDADLRAKFKNHQKELIETQRPNANRGVRQANGQLTGIGKELSEATVQATVDLLSSTCNKFKNSQQETSSSPILRTNHIGSPLLNKSLGGLPHIHVDTTDATSSLPQKSSTQLDSDSVQFAVSAVLSTVNNLQSNSNNSSHAIAPSSTNGPTQLSSRGTPEPVCFYERSPLSFTPYQPPQMSQQFISLNNRLIGSNSAATQPPSSAPTPSFITNSSAASSNSQLLPPPPPPPPSITQQLLAQPPQWPNNRVSAGFSASLSMNVVHNQQQSSELTNSSPNVFKLKFSSNNQNSLNSEQPKLTPTDVT